MNQIIELQFYLFQSQFQQNMNKRLRKHKLSFEPIQHPPKELSTEAEDSPRSPRQAKPLHRYNKEKLQLCRKFSEFGYCPYNNKCKFAHGSHELRKNNTANSKYKTKECVTYFRDGHCCYGSRCNFLHTRKESQVQSKFQALSNFRQLYHVNRNQSRLLKLL